MIRRLALVGSAAGALVFCHGALAAVQDPVPIRPDQSFVGLVNGVTSNATIRMACFGPVRPGQLGHPFAGQSLEVQITSPSAALSGFTGQAKQIEASFAGLPAASAAPELLATFDSYYVLAPISTSAVFPCGGSGTIAFTPVNGGPLGRPSDVSVAFVGQP